MSFLSCQEEGSTAIFVNYIYISSYLAGKYIIAPLVLNPFQSRGDFGRSLEDYQMLDTLSAGVMKALETYNLLQSLNGDI